MAPIVSAGRLTLLISQWSNLIGSGINSNQIDAMIDLEPNLVTVSHHKQV